MTDNTEKKYQHYSSSIQSIKTITPKGKKVVFVRGEFITDDKDIISFLDEEISNGLKVFTKGALLTHEEADPMANLKKRHIEEYLAEEKRKATDLALGKLPNMGSTAVKAPNLIQPIGAMSAQEVANVVTPATTK
jgi:hypothetical protein